MIFGSTVFLAFGVLGVGSIVIAVMTAVDASKYPDWAFERAGTSKFVWQILPVILLFVMCGIGGGVLGVVWYGSKREVVERAAHAGGPPSGYGGPPSGYGGPPLGYGAPPGWGPPPASAGWAPPPAPAGWAPPPAAGPPTSYPPPPEPPPAPPQ